tara:strand:+ start:118 stop:345 length:228 start_codon:yes stop_codon:yes gene_type:complete
MYYPKKPFYSMNIVELKKHVNKMRKNYPMDNIKKRKKLKIKLRKYKTRKLRKRKRRNTRKILMLSFDKTKSLKHI